MRRKGRLARRHDLISGRATSVPTPPTAGRPVVRTKWRQSEEGRAPCAAEVDPRVEVQPGDIHPGGRHSSQPSSHFLTGPRLATIFARRITDTSVRRRALQLFAIVGVGDANQGPGAFPDRLRIQVGDAVLCGDVVDMIARRDNAGARLEGRDDAAEDGAIAQGGRPKAGR